MRNNRFKNKLTLCTTVDSLCRHKDSHDRLLYHLVFTETVFQYRPQQMGLGVETNKVQACYWKAGIKQRSQLLRSDGSVIIQLSGRF